MYKDLLARPLRQAMLALWLVGLAHIGVWLAQARPLGALAGSALLGAVLSVLLAGRLRRPLIVIVAVALGLVAVLAAAERLGVSSTAAPILLITLYALLLWRLVCRTLDWPGTARLARALDLAGGYGAGGGRAAVEAVAHWSCLALSLLAVSAGAREYASPTSFPASLPAAPLTALGVSLAFLWLAGRRYRLMLHSYLLVALGAWAVLSVYAWAGATAGSNPSIALGEPANALLLALYGLAAWALGRWLDEGDHGLAPSLDSLYATPLQASATVLACLAAGLTLALASLGAVAAPGWSAMTACAVAALVLLLPNRRFGETALRLSGMLLSALALAWCYSAAIHAALPFGLWPGGPATGDQWLVTAVLAMAIASIAQGLDRDRNPFKAYAWPLWLAALAIWSWTLLGALALFSEPRTPYLPSTLAILTVALFPLLRPFEAGPAVRGLGVALLASALFGSLLVLEDWSDWGNWAPAALAWAYALWAIGDRVLPRFNARFPQWAVAPETWPWLGLISLTLGLAAAATDGLLSWDQALAAAGYLLLMLRVSPWPGFPWIAVMALAWAGLAWSASRHLDTILSWSAASVAATAVETLLLANALLLVVPLWRRYGEMLTERLALKNGAIEGPLTAAAVALCVLWLLALCLWDLAMMLEPELTASTMLIGGLLALSLLHALWWWRSRAVAHLLILALLATVLSLPGAADPFYLALVLALWSLALVVAASILPRFIPRDANPPLPHPSDKTGQREGVLRDLVRLITRALASWVQASTLIAAAVLVLMPSPSITVNLASIALLSITAAALGWQKLDRRWLLGAAGLALVWLHGLWLAWLPMDRSLAALPWMALELAVLIWVAAWLRERMVLYATRASKEHAPQGCAARLTALAQTLAEVTPWVAALAVAEWLMHGLIFALALAGAASTQPLAGAWGDGLAALAAAGLLLALAAREARRRDSEIWVYGAALLAGLAGAYLRLLWVGLAPLSVWDTAALMGAAYGLFVLQRLTLSRPVLRLVMVMPVLALLTVPLQLGSGHAGLALLAAATLYLLTRRATGGRAPLYLGLLALNAGIYLWVPGWAQHYGLFQVYLVPAALSVLALLHLHRHELKHSVLSAGRLAALSVLYAVSTLDVFLREDLAVFVLALSLSIAGIALGIALRTRAFLYAGVSFLVVNVLGQLIQLYPEQRLARALVLMALGAAITALMIAFNMQREAILSRIRVFRADLESWA